MSVEASPIILVRRATEEAVEAELLDGIGSDQILDWHRCWQPALGELKARLASEGVPQSKMPQSAHWDWPRKVNEVAGLIGFRSFSVVAEGVTQGLMRLDLTKSARLEVQLGKPLVYVDYVEVAPWNQPFDGGGNGYRGVGTALLVTAVALSIEEGFKGRMGLHSLPQSEGFYLHYNMADLGPDDGCQNLRYFEMTPEAAQALLG